MMLVAWLLKRNVNPDGRSRFCIGSFSTKNIQSSFETESEHCRLFEKQANKKNCGICTSTILLNTSLIRNGVYEGF